MSLSNLPWETDFEFASQQYFLFGRVDDIIEVHLFSKIEKELQALVRYDEI
jgi:hypothetical protein